MTPAFGQRFRLTDQPGVWVFIGHDVNDDELPHLLRPLGSTDDSAWATPAELTPSAEPLTPRIDGCLPAGTLVLVGEDEELGLILDVDETDSRMPYWVSLRQDDATDESNRWCEPDEVTAVSLRARVFGRQVYS